MEEKFKGFDLTEFENPEKAQAVIQHLDLDGETDTVEESEDIYTINSRKVKEGTTPEEYAKIIQEFKKLLSEKDKEKITGLLNIPQSQISEQTQNKIYHSIESKLKTVKETEATKYLKAKCLYIENILYHLVEGKREESYVKSYIEAWQGKKVKDRREWFNRDNGEYLVLTETEAEQKAKEYLTDDTELWKQAVEHNHVTQGLDKWAEQVINIDGLGHILSTYDGNEETAEVKGTTYLIFRTN